MSGEKFAAIKLAASCRASARAGSDWELSGAVAHNMPGFAQCSSASNRSVARLPRIPATISLSGISLSGATAPMKHNVA